MSDQIRLAVPSPGEPLAARMRPRTLDEVIGQDHLVGNGRLLRRSIEADRLGSMIFAGPPGTGKTTLAQVVAGSTRATFVAMNAVLAGVKDIRDAVRGAEDRRAQSGRRTVLFVDEVHRFNKAQQDALLPWVENGTVILVGATTENPYFEVNKALVSRSRIFQLVPLTRAALERVLQAALSADRGYADRPIDLSPEAAAHLVDVCNGDARALLNALELAVETTPPGLDGRIRIGLGVAEESIQRRAVLYDRDGDAHFDTISAFVKSIRGSDPDAALYWLARMVHAGEEPRFIFRRLLILASEDVGLADPGAIGVVTACADAFDRVGLPEGRFALAHATLHLTLAEKSNSTMGFFEALAAVEGERTAEVPPHLKDPSRDGPGLGHGEGYVYPHAFRAHWVAQAYLPSTLHGRVFYQSNDAGWEGVAGARWEQRREAHLAAMLEAPPEHLTTGPADSSLDAWAQRTARGSSQRAAAARDHLLRGLPARRHDVLLELGPGSGLVTWELLRRVPEGALFVARFSAAEAEVLLQGARRLDPLRRPVWVEGGPDALGAAVGPQRFEGVVGRDLLTEPAWIAAASAVLSPGGWIVLLETVRRQTQRLVDLGSPSGDWVDEVRAAEDAVWTGPDIGQLEATLRDLGFDAVQATPLVAEHGLRISTSTVERWFGPEGYATRLECSAGARKCLEIFVRSEIMGREVPWRSGWARLQGQLRASSDSHRA